MRSIIVECGPYAAPSATNIRTASAVTAGAVVLNGSLVTTTTTGNTYSGSAITVTVATLDKPRRVLFTSVGNDSGITFTITGTDWNNNPASEVLTGANAASVYTVYDYKTVTSVVASGVSAGNVSIGTNGYASSRPVFLDTYADSSTYIQTDTGGSSAITYSIQLSGDNPNNAQIGMGSDTYSNARWINSGTAALVNATTSQNANQAGVPNMIRCLVTNAGSNTTASVHVNFNQSGMVSY
jgi:hypothetical protein